MPCPICGTSLAINILQSSLVGMVGVGMKEKLGKKYIAKTKPKESKARILTKKSNDR